MVPTVFLQRMPTTHRAISTAGAEKAAAAGSSQIRGRLRGTGKIRGAVWFALVCGRSDRFGAARRENHSPIVTIAHVEALLAEVQKQRTLLSFVAHELRAICGANSAD